MSTLTIYRIDVSAQSVVCKVCHNFYRFWRRWEPEESMTMELNGASVVRISITRRIRSKENRKLSSDGGMTVLKWIPLARRRFRHRCVDIHNNYLWGKFFRTLI